MWHTPECVRHRPIRYRSTTRFLDVRYIGATARMFVKARFGMRVLRALPATLESKYSLKPGEKAAEVR
jgi:hypothetical protein